jgi:hypothetical protein
MNTTAEERRPMKTDINKVIYLQSLAKSISGADNKSQCTRLREALSRYSLTTFEAMRYLDIYHVPARILQLRSDGDEIVTTWEKVETEQGHTHRVGQYTLASKGVSHA